MNALLQSLHCTAMLSCVILIELRQHIGTKKCTHSVICGNKDKRHFPFLPQITLWTYWDIQHWLATKSKLPTTFLGAQTQMGAETHSFTQPFCRTYVYAHHNNEWSPQTISHSEQDESVNRTCFRVRPQHSATQSGCSRQRGGQIRKGSRLKRQLRRCHYACLPSKGPYPPPRRQKQCLLFYLATGV